MEKVKVDLEELNHRLDYWLDKVEGCYKEEVEHSMDDFRKEIGIGKNNELEERRECLNIKDFDIGQTIYILQMHTGRNQKPTIRESKVKAIGRKYLTITNDNRYLSEDWFDFGLVENTDWGERTLLCPSVEHANMYIEKCKLVKWFIGISVNHAQKYTLEQLREIKSILDDSRND